MSWITKECAYGRFFRSILLMSCMYGCWFPSPLQAEPVKLAVLLPFSGVFRDHAVAAKNGFLLGLKKEASEAQVNIESWVTFDYLDTLADADHGLELAKKVIREGAKAILGIAGSDVASKLKEYVLHEAQVPFIIIVSTGIPELRSTHPLYLRISGSNYRGPIGLALWVKEHPVVSTIKPRWACIYSDYVVGTEQCDGFALAYKQIGEEIGRIPAPFKTFEQKPQLVQAVQIAA
jgi:branched-chain amino acid transport system substrate-binding protein